MMQVSRITAKENIILTRDEVAAHEHLRELVGVLVLAKPDGVVLLVELFPKVRHGLGLVLVGVEPLEVVHVERALGHGGERVLGLGLRRERELGLVHLLRRFGFLGRLGLLLLLLVFFLLLFLVLLTGGCLVTVAAELALDLGEALGVELAHLGAELEVTDH